MSSVDARIAPRTARTLNGLRTNAFAAVVMLLIEFGLGVGVNLDATLPAADAGKGLLPAFGRAVTDGPIVLTVHALLGTTLLITGLAAVVRASLARRPLFVGLTSSALLALVVAWFAGARFVGDQASGASLAMASATGLSILCYALILFVVPGTAAGDRQR